MRIISNRIGTSSAAARKTGTMGAVGFALLMEAALLPIGCGGGGNTSTSTATTGNADSCTSYVPLPTITSVSPSQGAIGSRVTIKGSGFLKCTSDGTTSSTPFVIFGDANSQADTKQTVITDDNTLSVVVPVPHGDVTKPVDIRMYVTIPMNASASQIVSPKTDADHFTYVSGT